MALSLPAVLAFYQHLEDCIDCNEREPRSLCGVGCDLLLEASDQLPASWHPVIRMLRDQERLEKEAAANFAFYSDESEET